MTHFTETIIEETALEWLKNLGYTIVFGNAITPENMLAGLRDGLSMPRVMRSWISSLIMMSSIAWALIHKKKNKLT